MAKNINILLTCVGGGLVPRAIELLKESEAFEFRVIGIDTSTDAVGAKFCDRFYQAPMGDTDEYPEFLLELCKKEKIEVLIPWSDEEALSIALARDQFERNGVAVAAPPVEVAKITHNKADVLDLLQKSNVPVPEYRRAKNAEELILASKELGYPNRTIIVKPTVARGGRGAWALRESGAALKDLMESVALDVITLDTFVSAARGVEMPEVMVMPFFPGMVYDVDILQEGKKLHYLVPRRRFHVRTAPFRGCIIHKNDAVIDLAHQVGSTLDMHCLYDIDLIMDEKDHPWVLEINPRLSASVVATMEAGLPLLEYLIRMVCGLSVPINAIPFDRRIRPYTLLVEDGYAL